MSVEELVEVIAGEYLEYALGFPPGVFAAVKWFIDDDECVNCDCEDAECSKISVDGDEVGCECCIDI